MTVRCFVALWPDADVRMRLDAIARELRARLDGGRPVPASNLHLTLAFIGELGEKRAHDVALDLAENCFAPFDWVLDHVGHFARAKVVWAGGRGSEPLLAHAAEVRRGLGRLGVPFDPKPFAPHITLLRDAIRGQAVAGPLAASVPWRVGSPMLLRTEFAGGRPCYRPVA